MQLQEPPQQWVQEELVHSQQLGQLEEHQTGQLVVEAITLCKEVQAARQETLASDRGLQVNISLDPLGDLNPSAETSWCTLPLWESPQIYPFTHSSMGSSPPNPACTNPQCSNSSLDMLLMPLTPITFEQTPETIPFVLTAVTATLSTTSSLIATTSGTNVPPLLNATKTTFSQLSLVAKCSPASSMKCRASYAHSLLATTLLILP